MQALDSPSARGDAFRKCCVVMHSHWHLRLLARQEDTDSHHLLFMACRLDLSFV